MNLKSPEMNDKSLLVFQIFFREINSLKEKSKTELIDHIEK